MLEQSISILYIGVPFFDYLADSFLIGLKSQSDYTIVEWKPNLIIYKTDKTLYNNHGMGFTLGKVLDVSLQKTYDKSMSLEKFDLFIFGSIKHQIKEFYQLRSYLRPDNTILLDGSDSASLYPFNGQFLKMTEVYKLPLLYKKFPYYKREWIPQESFFPKANKFIPLFISKFLFNSKHICPISFSIPDEKIIKKLPKKTKLFPKHVVDEEVAFRLKGSFTKYAFDNEEAYYADLQASKFGITTKRAGWDCMRHYEIAANGAVICFRDLNKKPPTCAPHGLIDGVNCISYQNYQDLMSKIEAITESQYMILQEASFRWVNEVSSKAVVLKLIKNYYERKDFRT